ncbi:LysR substrate-binding domain-containing protein [Pseudonocardia abyssalis]|uniref:LysR substrate-binding domain-containing protein n=1 Tax=Pseudonocardia abyssalis TaxID=2792008 RepID=UPI001CF62594|nr:LysR substrate-binding domain-containing protein [Pseudonocardia abyssalis]
MPHEHREPRRARTPRGAPLDILVGPAHPLAGRDGVGLAEFAADPWIGSNPGRAYHQLVTLACAGAGFAPDVVHYADEWDTGAALVARGFGVALVPRLAELPAHDTRRIPISTAPAPIRRVVAAVRAGSRNRPGTAAGLAALRHATASLAPALGGSAGSTPVALLRAGRGPGPG